MPHIFISYRRDDSEGYAVLLRERLEAHFGLDAVFQDITSIPPGKNLRKYIAESVGSCRVLLVLIDKQWLTIADAGTGARRLDQPDDFVRLEIAAGLAHALTVIPVLLRGTPPPRAADLPDDLKPLAELAAHSIGTYSLDDDVQRLIGWLDREGIQSQPAFSKTVRPDHIQKTITPPAKPVRWMPVAVVIGIVALAAVIGGLALSSVFGKGAPATPTSAPTSAATLSPTIDPTAALAEADITSNGQWKPVIQEFGDVKMALVPNGCFQMGSNDGDPDEKPVHQACFDKPFWLDVYEVTQAQFTKLGGQAAHAVAFSGDNLPRESITWTEADAFCRKRDARLPTEAEWEYAARGPDGLIYPWGNEFVGDNVVFADNALDKTWDAGSKPNGISWVGAFDLSGSVWEWIADWYGAYSPVQQVNPTGPGGGNTHVLRGGSWLDDAGHVRASVRGGYRPDHESEGFGFRCASSAGF